MPRAQEVELKRQLSSSLIDTIVAVRQRRRLVEENWLRSRRAWMNMNFESHFHSTDTSPNNYNVPAARRAAERSVVRGIKLLTPNVKWFEVAPMGDTTDEKIDNVDKFMWYILRKRIKSRSNISQLVRSMCMYGLCHIKTGIVVQNGQVWPTQRAVDPFAFYTFPETASTPDEADLIFEDFLFSYERYKTFSDRGIVEEINKSDLVKPDWPYHLTERLAYQGITDPTQDINVNIDKVSNSLERIGAGFVSLTELWLPKNDALYQVYIAWNLKEGASVVGFVKSEYDQPLYRSVIHRPLPGELYTNSQMDDITELNTMQNDDINKFKDAVDWEQGFVAFSNQGSGGDMRRDSYKMKGRAKWEFSDDPRQMLQFINPPNTSTNILRAWQIELGLINSLAGSGTIAEGQPGRNMPRAGNAVNSLINLGMADIQDISELIEQEVLTPSLSDIYKVSTAFIPDHQLMKIPGGKGLFGSILKRADIIGDYEFEWVGSLQFQDESQRAQRLMIFLNLMPTLAPMLQQQGYQFDAPKLIKMIWRYGLGERGLSEVVKPIQQQQVQQPLSPGQEGGESPVSDADVKGSGVAGLQYQLPKPTNGFVRQ
jgi:hypothetical protein